MKCMNCMVCFIFLVGVNVAIIVCFFSLHDVNKPAYRGKEPPDGKLPPPPLTQSPPFHLTPPPPPHPPSHAFYLEKNDNGQF